MVQQLTRGVGSLAKIPAVLEKLGVRKPLAVCSNSLRPALAEALGEHPHAVFSGFHANPDFQDCAAGRAMYLAQGCDGLVSLGGGSAMDTAKAIKALLLAPDAGAVLTGQWEARPLDAPGHSRYRGHGERSHVHRRDVRGGQEALPWTIRRCFPRR